jgi:hypothetical protein
MSLGSESKEDFSSADGKDEEKPVNLSHEQEIVRDTANP